MLLSTLMATASSFPDKAAPLLIAAESGDIKQVQDLVLNQGIDVNKRYTHSMFNKLAAPLHYACRSGHLNVAEFLLSHGATIGVFIYLYK